MKLAAYSQVGRGDIMQRGFQGACSTCNVPFIEHHGDTDGPGRSAGHRTAFKALINTHRTRWAFLASHTDARSLPGRAVAARCAPHAPQRPSDPRARSGRPAPP